MNFSETTSQTRSFSFGNMNPDCRLAIRSVTLVSVALFCALILFPSPAGGFAPQETEAIAVSPQTELIQEINALKTQAAQAQLEEAQQKSVDASLAAAEQSVQKAAANDAAVVATRDLIQTAAQRVETIKAELEQLRATKPEKIEEIPSAELSQAATDAQSNLSQLQNQLRDQQDKLAQQTRLIAEARQSLLALETRKSEAQTQLGTTPPVGEPAILTASRKAELASFLIWVDSESARVQAEIELGEAEQRLGLLTASVELLTLKTKTAQTRADEIDQKLSEQRRAETQQSANTAREDAARADPRLRPIADVNAEIAEKASNLLGPMEKAQAELKLETDRLKDLDKKFLTTKLRVETVGLTSSVGEALRNRKAELSRQGWLGPVVAARKTEIENTQSDLFDLEEQRQFLLGDDIVNEVLDKEPDLSDAEREHLTDATRFLVDRRRDLLKQAIDNHESYLATLYKLDEADRSLSRKTSEFHEYINERILWIRSNDVLFTNLTMDRSRSVLLDAGSWTAISTGLQNDAISLPLLYAVLALVFAYLWFSRSRMRKAIEQNSATATRGTNKDFWPTLETVFLTIAIACLIPLILIVVGWRLTLINTGSALSIAVGWALIGAGWFYFTAEVLRQVCRKSGLAESHFKWAAGTVAKLKTELRWFVPFGAIMSFVCGLLYLVDVNHESDTVERIVYLFALVGLTVFVYRTMHPKHGIFREQIAKHPKAWIVQIRNIWFTAILLIPFSLMVMVVIGYYYSAIQMNSRLFDTAVAVVAIEIVRSLLARFILLSRRKARIEQARARVLAQTSVEGNAQVAELQRAADQEAVLAEASATIDENVLRSRKLIFAGVMIAWLISISFIWADVFPALRGLDKYVLWSTPIETKVTEVEETKPATSASPSPISIAPSTASSNGTETDSGSKLVETTRREIKEVTLRNLLYAVFILAVSIFVVQNLPGFIELVFLKHLPVDQSVRHAFKAITGYICLLIGVVAASRSMYIGWSQIQWLATALTFGLAFGLQEIFANFIAGIILLLERPIRIGDVISVDDVTGTVSRIRIRATTIMDMDRKEYIVPNKEFITGRVLNWTLTDQVNRLMIRVGIAYGSDVRRAKELLLEICTNHPLVVETPPISVIFEEFADSSLNLTARAFVKDFESRWPALDEINLAIDDAFKAEGIEISFPQRDLHIRSASPGIEDALRGKPSHAPLNSAQNGNASSAAANKETRSDS